MKVHLENFRWHQLYDVTFEGLTRLNGSSGSGKSTIFNAVLWCLYGKVRVVQPHHLTTKKTKVVIEWDGIIVSRSKGPNLLTVTIPRRHCKTGDIDIAQTIKDDCIMYQDETAQKWIDQTWGDQSMFLASSYLQQKEKTYLLELSNLEKFDLLNSISFRGDDPRIYKHMISQAKKVTLKQYQEYVIKYESGCTLLGRDLERKPSKYGESYDVCEDTINKLDRQITILQQNIKTCRIKYLERLKLEKIIQQKQLELEKTKTRLMMLSEVDLSILDNFDLWRDIPILVANLQSIISKIITLNSDRNRYIQLSKIIPSWHQELFPSPYHGEDTSSSSINSYWNHIELVISSQISNRAICKKYGVNFDDHLPYIISQWEDKIRHIKYQQEYNTFVKRKETRYQNYLKNKHQYDDMIEQKRLLEISSDSHEKDLNDPNVLSMYQMAISRSNDIIKYRTQKALLKEAEQEISSLPDFSSFDIFLNTSGDKTISCSPKDISKEISKAIDLEKFVRKYYPHRLAMKSSYNLRKNLMDRYGNKTDLISLIQHHPMKCPHCKTWLSHKDDRLWSIQEGITDHLGDHINIELCKKDLQQWENLDKQWSRWGIDPENCLVIVLWNEQIDSYHDYLEERDRRESHLKTIKQKYRDLSYLERTLSPEILESMDLREIDSYVKRFHQKKILDEKLDGLKSVLEQWIDEEEIMEPPKVILESSECNRLSYYTGMVNVLSQIDISSYKKEWIDITLENIHNLKNYYQWDHQIRNESEHIKSYWEKTVYPALSTYPESLKIKEFIDLQNTSTAKNEYSLHNCPSLESLNKLKDWIRWEYTDRENKYKKANQTRNELEVVTRNITVIQSQYNELCDNPDRNMDFLEQENVYREQLDNAVKDKEDRLYSKGIQERQSELLDLHNLILESDQKNRSYEVLYSLAHQIEQSRLDDRMDRFNWIINNICSQLFDDEIQIIASTTKITKTTKQLRHMFDLKLVLKGIETEYSSLSGGEKDRISLAITLALSYLCPSPLIMLDECLSSLDSGIKERVVNVLRTHCSHKIVVCIDHEINSAWFDKVIDIT